MSWIVGTWNNMVWRRFLKVKPKICFITTRLGSLVHILDPKFNYIASVVFNVPRTQLTCNNHTENNIQKDVLSRNHSFANCLNKLPCNWGCFDNTVNITILMFFSVWMETTRKQALWNPNGHLSWFDKHQQITIVASNDCLFKMYWTMKIVRVKFGQETTHTSILDL